MKKKKNVTAQVKSHVKGISAILVGYGVGEIMGYVMKDFKPDAKGVRKALIKIGALAMTGMVIKSVTDFVDGEIDEVFDIIDEVQPRVEQKVAEILDDDEQ